MQYLNNFISHYNNFVSILKLYLKNYNRIFIFNWLDPLLMALSEVTINWNWKSVSNDQNLCLPGSNNFFGRTEKQLVTRTAAAIPGFAKVKYWFRWDCSKPDYIRISQTGMSFARFRYRLKEISSLAGGYWHRSLNSLLNLEQDFEC